MDNKDKVINELLSRIAKLEYEVEEKENIIKEVREWLEEDYEHTIKYEICDNPRYYLNKLEKILGSDKE